MTEPNENAGPEAVGRRQFLKLVGAAGIAGALPAAVTAFAQAAAPATAGAPVPAVASADSTAPAAAPAGPSEDAIALAGILRRRFPGRLTEEQWKKVTGDLDSNLARGVRLRGFKLGNDAEPDSTFRA